MLIVEMATAVREAGGSRFTRGCAEAAFVGERTKRQITPQFKKNNKKKIKSSMCSRSFTQVHP